MSRYSAVPGISAVPSFATRWICLLIGLVFTVSVSQTAEAKFPYKWASGKSRIEGPIVPAPKNWGYRPTRWVRWETDIIHPAIGPIAADAKKESKTAEEHAAATAQDAAPSTKMDEKSASVEPLPDGPVLPPLPTDGGLPPLPQNLDDDLPPLPGEDFGSPTASPPKATPRKDSAPAGSPSFRDPDTIFDRPSKSEKSGSQPDATPGTLPPLPQESPKTNSTRPPQRPTPPAEITKPPQSEKPATPEPAKKGPPSDDAQQWEKRKREKPTDPKGIEKKAPTKKPGDPFYDPDSIFDERSSRAVRPENIRWKQAGTTSQTAGQSSPARAAAKTATNTTPDPVFSQVKAAAAPAQKVVKQRPDSDSATPALFKAERPRPISPERAEWKATTTEKIETENQLPPARAMQDGWVRPATFEQPIPERAEKSRMPSALTAETPRAKATPGRQSKPGPSNTQTASISKAGLAANRQHRKSNKTPKPTEAAAADEAPRNPMRDPVTRHAGDQQSDANPLRENAPPTLSEEPQRANPLR